MSGCKLAFSGTQRYYCPIIILEYNQFSLFIVVRFQQGFANTKLMITEPSFLGECRVGFFELLVTTF